MLTTQGETSESDILQRISVARGKSEPEQSAPTEETSAVDVSEAEAPAVDEIEEEVETLTDDAETVEEEDDQVAAATTDDDESEDLYVDYKGREINLKDVEEWEQGHLRQSDYTRKTQELSEQRKTFEAEKEDFTAKREQLQGSIATLEAIISEETLTPEAIAELREYEPEAYILHQEKMVGRKKALEDAGGSQPISDNVDIEAERQQLWSANPSWLKDGKQTDAFTNDMNMLQSYGRANGYTDEEMGGFQHARHFEALIKAAKYDAISKKNAAIDKKVRKAPVSTKPKQAAQSSLVSQIKKAEAQLKKSGIADDAVKLRQLRRKAQG